MPGVSFIKLSIDFILKVYVGTKARFYVCTNVFRFIKPCVCHNLRRNHFINPNQGKIERTCISSSRGANLSPFGEIRRFHLEIGHSRELCRSVKKIFEERRGEGRRGEGRGGGRHRISESSVSRHLQRLSPCWQWTRPTLSLIGLPWGRSPLRCGLSPIFFMTAKRTRNTRQF